MVTGPRSRPAGSDHGDDERTAQQSAAEAHQAAFIEPLARNEPSLAGAQGNSKFSPPRLYLWGRPLPHTAVANPRAGTDRPDRARSREPWITDLQARGRNWIEVHSARADGLATAEIEAFVTRFETSQRDPSKRVSAATLTRFLQALKSCWAWAITRDDIPIDRNPWLVIRPQRKVKGKNSLNTGRGSMAVDADLVIGVNDAFALAEACAHQGAWGNVVECFTLVMALCGLRLGEAAGLLGEDLELPDVGDAGWVTVRRTPDLSLPVGSTPTKTPNGVGSRQGSHRHSPGSYPPDPGCEASRSFEGVWRRARRTRLPPQLQALRSRSFRPQRHEGASPAHEGPSQAMAQLTPYLRLPRQHRVPVPRTVQR